MPPIKTHDDSSAGTLAFLCLDRVEFSRTNEAVQHGFWLSLRSMPRFEQQMQIQLLHIINIFHL